MITTGLYILLGGLLLLGRMVKGAIGGLSLGENCAVQARATISRVGLIIGDEEF